MNRTTTLLVLLSAVSWTGCSTCEMARREPRLVLCAYEPDSSDPYGHRILTDNDIELYKWSDHSLKLHNGIVDRIFRDGTVEGATFAVLADGHLCYSGRFVSSLGSTSMVGIFIVNPTLFATVDPRHEEDVIRITRDYPAMDAKAPGDLRDNPRVRDVLRELGKLCE